VSFIVSLDTWSKLTRSSEWFSVAIFWFEIQKVRELYVKNCKYYTSTINPDQLSDLLSFANVFVFEFLSHIKIHLVSMAYAELRDVRLKSNGWCLLVRENHPNQWLINSSRNIRAQSAKITKHFHPSATEATLGNRSSILTSVKRDPSKREFESLQSTRQQLYKSGGLLLSES